MITLDNILLKIKDADKFSYYDLNSNSINLEINKFIKFDKDNQDNNSLMWISNKNIQDIKNLKYGIIIISMEHDAFAKDIDSFRGVRIFCNNPRRIFKELLPLFKKDYKNHFLKIFKSKKIYVGNGTIIEDDVEIGTNVFIGYNNVIHSGTRIGNNVKIGSNNVIGGVGFGYEKNEDGRWDSIDHIGGVIIRDYVEIGNNNCIDKAVLGYTEIGENTKIDNLVHIAHGVIIGNNSLIIANSMIAGSCNINDNVWIGPSTSILNGVTIEKNSITGVGAVVIRDVAEGKVVAGVPAKSIKG